MSCVSEYTSHIAEFMFLLRVEVVLATLLSNFKFEFSNTPIVWNFGGISYPAKSEESMHPEMYLKVSLAA